MKLATYKDGSRDGQLVVVSRDLSTAHYATGIAHKLQQALDDWNFISPQLQDLYVTLNQGKARHAFPFDPAQCMAPLPRAYQWADGSAYINHVELVRAARSSDVPHSFYTDPLMYQGGSDDFIGPCEDVIVASEDFGIDFEAEIAVITGDVKMGNGGGYKTGGVAKANAGGYKEGGAPKKAYATGGRVDSGRPVAMPQGSKPAPKPVSINRLSGTYKDGGRVKKDAYDKIREMKVPESMKADMQQAENERAYKAFEAEQARGESSLGDMLSSIPRALRGLFSREKGPGAVTEVEKSVTVEPGKKRGGAC